jgi:hypothetical protein
MIFASNAGKTLGCSASDANQKLRAAIDNMSDDHQRNSQPGQSPEHRGSGWLSAVSVEIGEFRTSDELAAIGISKGSAR